MTKDINGGGVGGSGGGGKLSFGYNTLQICLKSPATFASQSSLSTLKERGGGGGGGGGIGGVSGSSRLFSSPGGIVDQSRDDSDSFPQSPRESFSPSPSSSSSIAASSNTGSSSARNNPHHQNSHQHHPLNHQVCTSGGDSGCTARLR